MTLSSADLQYLDGFLNLVTNPELAGKSMHQACIDAISNDERFAGKDASEVFFSWLTEGSA